MNSLFVVVQGYLIKEYFANYFAYGDVTFDEIKFYESS